MKKDGVDESYEDPLLVIRAIAVNATQGTQLRGLVTPAASTEPTRKVQTTGTATSQPLAAQDTTHAVDVNGFEHDITATKSTTIPPAPTGTVNRLVTATSTHVSDPEAQSVAVDFLSKGIDMYVDFFFGLV